MPAVKSSSAIAQKWARVTPQRTQDFEEGVRNPRKSWEEGAAEAASAQAEGVQQAINEGRFEKGVRKAGNEKWQRKTIEKGVRRWGPGVQVAQNDFESGFAPYRQVIESTTLPPRFAKGDPRNLERVAAMATALHEAKRGLA